jgi:hypothetical protein
VPHRWDIDAEGLDQGLKINVEIERLLPELVQSFPALYLGLCEGLRGIDGLQGTGDGYLAVLHRAIVFQPASCGFPQEVGYLADAFHDFSAQIDPDSELERVDELLGLSFALGEFGVQLV